MSSLLRAQKMYGPQDVPTVPEGWFSDAFATEYLPGVHVRVTVRDGTVLRTEVKRGGGDPRVLPWYRETDDYDVWQAVYARNDDWKKMRDGDYVGQAVGPNLAGNPLDIDEPTVVLLHWRDGEVPRFETRPQELIVPRERAQLTRWLASTRSLIAPNSPLQGVVWQHRRSYVEPQMIKVLTKDLVEC